MIAQHVRRSFPLIAAAAFAIFAVVALGLALAWRSADRTAAEQRLEEGRITNCQAIEALKAQLRPEPFDLANTKRILTDINIDPESDTGKRLIDESRDRNARERKQLAPSDC